MAEHEQTGSAVCVLRVYSRSVRDKETPTLELGGQLMIEDLDVGNSNLAASEVSKRVLLAVNDCTNVHGQPISLPFLPVKQPPQAATPVLTSESFPRPGEQAQTQSLAAIYRSRRG